MPQIGRYRKYDGGTGVQHDERYHPQHGCRFLFHRVNGRIWPQRPAAKADAHLSGGTPAESQRLAGLPIQSGGADLDEPTASLDPLASRATQEKDHHRKSKGRLILITSHILSELDELITQVMYMQDGQVLFHKNGKNCRKTQVNKNYRGRLPR